MNIRTGFCTCSQSHLLFLTMLKMTSTASITLIPNIHLLDISVLLAVLKIPDNSLLSEILPCCLYSPIKSLIHYLLMKSNINQKLFLAFIACRSHVTLSKQPKVPEIAQHSTVVNQIDTLFYRMQWKRGKLHYYNTWKYFFFCFTW